MTNGSKNSTIRYEPNENPPRALSIGLGIQLAVLCLAGIVLTPVIIIRAGLGEGHEDYLSWAVFAAVLISGITSMVQARRIGRVGAGYVLLMGSSGAFIAICINALQVGGAAMLAVLVIISSLFQFLLAWRLSLFRRILTPAVSGTVLMLIAVTVMPIAFDMLKDVPAGAPAKAAPVSATITVMVICAIALKARGAMRLWAPVIGVAVGSVVASFYGIYDTGTVADARWFGLSFAGFPGMDLSFSGSFWMLLPAFVFVTLIGAIETIGDAIAIQKVSWKRPRAVDFRAVQGALNADGVGNLFSGLLGTVPNTTYSSSVSMTELTGVASRHVGIAIGCVFLLLAFLPKALAVAVGIPSPVIAAFLLVLIPMLFVLGMKIVVDSGLSYRKGIIVGVSFWVGVGFQEAVIFPEIVEATVGTILNNGMTAGGILAIVLTVFTEISDGRRSRLKTRLSMESLPELQKFTARYANRTRWDKGLRTRLDIASEEALVTLVGDKNDHEHNLRHLQVTIRNNNGEPELEMVASDTAENIEDRIALLHEVKPKSMANLEQEVSLRLLHHVSSSVKHTSYHDTEIITIRVK